ncbi:MAG: hypothetical protein ACOC89_02520 [Candidatus Saliniplasma sp.]
MEKKVKGTHMINILDYVEEKKGKLGLENLWEEIEERSITSKKEYDEKEWVDYDLVIKFFETIEDIFGSDLKKVPRSREIGRHITSSLGHLEYLTVAQGLKELIEKAEDNWEKVYNFGSIELADWTEEGKAVIKYHGFPANKHVCNYFQGSLEKDIELLELDGEIEHTACPVEGDEYIEFQITW